MEARGTRAGGCAEGPGRVLAEVVPQGAKVLPSDKKTRYLLQNQRQLHNISEGGAAANDDGANAVVRRGYEEPQPPVAAGREPVEEMAQRGKENAAGEALREECQSTTRVALVQQMTITRSVDNAAQKKLDIAWVEAMFRAGIPFNFLNFNTTLKLHEVYLEMASARPKVKLPSAKHIQTVMLDFIFLRIQKQVQPLTACWDVTGYTFITDGSTDRRERPAMNLLAAGEQGAALVATVPMDGKKKTGPAALARLWEMIMREVGLQRINTICTDNAEREGWWPELKKVVEVMEPLYVLLRRMDKDATALSNLVEYDQLMERMLAEVVLTKEQRRTVLEKIGGPWKSNAHVQMLSDLREFHMKPTGYNPRRKDKKMWDGDAVADSNTISPSEWWATHGGDVPELQAIAMKVMGMWSTVTLAARNWSSMDLVHSKWRNRLNPSTLQKLVYIHWNMQLLQSGKNLKDHGYINLWAQFFESLPEPQVDSGSILKDPVEEKDKTEEELVRERAFIKTPKGRIPKSLKDEEEEEECTDDSDLDDEVWKGKTPWSEASSEGEVDESSDDDFELGIPPSIPCTTYVGRREAA
ncbi:hypothetical protein CBR_g32690 [Chara braunii]|uniref:DUF659 domain-containing protein n=1 Tax=Chara braunii TaxID=69332 RepID=A0A388LHA4_CHABU|nr:hypothetical protein CBR_g32690 [Chara braunii]|eukprot:GBG81696.1 hypothetical protein CBR_g32690 [Chara braunii]